jgi:hypothetical protein
MNVRQEMEIVVKSVLIKMAAMFVLVWRDIHQVVTVLFVLPQVCK